MKGGTERLHPLAVEPLIGQITLEWEERGPERAADLYGATVDVFQNPLLDLFAAECHAAAGQRDEEDGLPGETPQYLQGLAYPEEPRLVPHGHQQRRHTSHFDSARRGSGPIFFVDENETALFDHLIHEP